MIDYKDINQAANAVIKYAKGAIRETERFIANYEFSGDYEENLSQVISYAETSALISRSISGALRTDEDFVTDVDIHRNMDLPEVCSLNYDESYGGYVMTLPALNGKEHKRKRFGDTKWIRSIVSATILQSEITTQILENPMLIFEHHVDRNDSLARCIDSDNIDVKRVTDCLQGTFLKDDNSVYLATMHVGVLDDKSFSKLYIMPKTRLGIWIKNNENLLKKQVF